MRKVGSKLGQDPRPILGLTEDYPRLHHLEVCPTRVMNQELYIEKSISQSAAFFRLLLPSMYETKEGRENS
jgi:hypothetical protein